MSHPILIRQVSHLTDARYYAAMEIDYISMKLDDDPLSFSRWHAIQDWIEGVKLLAEPHSEDEAVIARCIIDTKPDGIIFKDLKYVHLTGGMDVWLSTEHPDPSSKNEFLRWIIPYQIYFSNQQLWKTYPDQLFIEADWTREMLEGLIDTGYNGGISFTTGPEESTGMKDYGDMDELIGFIKGH